MAKFSLSSEELDSFHRNGYIGPFTLYEPNEMNEIFQSLRRQLVDTKNSIYQTDGKIYGVTNLANYDRHLDMPFLFEHVCRREIVDRLCSILGDDVICWRTEFFPKYSGDEGTDWHQVKSFSAVSGKKSPSIQWPEDSGFSGAISVWCAFTESTIDNGCLKIIPETHGIMFYDESKAISYNPNKINRITKNGEKRGFFGYDFSELQLDENWRPDESKAVSLQMNPGQFVIFWSTLLHGSHPHSGKTNKMRLGYTARYVPNSVKIYPNMKQLEEFGAKASLEKYRAVLVSGKDEYHHNKLVMADFLK